MLALNFTPFPILQTERLVLRQLTMSDAEDIFHHRADERVNRYLEGFSHTSIEQTRAFIENIQKAVADNESILWIITEKGIDKFIGSICLWNISKEEMKAETGYTMHPDFQNKGYMQEAMVKVIDYGFNVMKLRAIEAHTHRDNEHSIKLLIRNNFKKTISGAVANGSENVIFVLTKTIE